MEAARFRFSRRVPVMAAVAPKPADGGAAGGPPPEQPPPPPPKAERLNQAVMQQLNLESVKTRALGLLKTISRILEDFDLLARTNTTPKW